MQASWRSVGTIIAVFRYILPLSHHYNNVNKNTKQYENQEKTSISNQ